MASSSQNTILDQGELTSQMRNVITPSLRKNSEPNSVLEILEMEIFVFLTLVCSGHSAGFNSSADFQQAYKAPQH